MMTFYEELLWILDKKGKVTDDEAEYQENIKFVHSLGKKCDRVGWSKLSSDDADAQIILDKINDFCKSDGWEARGYYKRSYPDISSEWFELQTADFKDASIADIVEVSDESGREVSLAIIRAYNELTSSPKEYLGICVPEHFRDVCLKNNIADVEFCWVQDKGKYDAQQYFYIYPDALIPQVACDRGLRKKDTVKINALGGLLPKIADVFTELQEIELPDCYLSKDMPKGGIAYSYFPETDTYCGRYKILIHKDTAEILVREKALSWNELKAVSALEDCPQGYILDKNRVKIKPSQKYIADSLKKYEIIKKSSRPIRVISEKDTLKFLRNEKRDRKEDFSKPIDKRLSEQLENSEYSKLLPYYKVANGGNLSDEYEFLSYENSVIATTEFFSDLKCEELLENKPEGVVFAKCADGDVVLFMQNGKVVRFSHEAPEIIREWNSVSQFFFDAITKV